MRYNKDNFYVGTKATFKGCNRPSRKPNYVSYDRLGEISSEYWYTNDGVIRCSDHWSTYYLRRRKDSSDANAIFSCNKVASCFWRLKTSRNNTNCGFAAWSAFSSM